METRGDSASYTCGFISLALCIDGFVGCCLMDDGAPTASPCGNSALLKSARAGHCASNAAGITWLPLISIVKPLVDIAMKVDCQ